MSYSLPYTPKKLGNSEAEAKTGTTHGGGQVYFTRGLSDRTSPTYTAETCREQQLGFDRTLDFAMQLAVEHVSGLTVGIAPGWYRKSDGTDVEFAGLASFAVTDATTNYLWIDYATGNVTKGASWPADKTTFMPLAKVIAAAGTVSSIIDCRSLVAHQGHATSSAPTGTTETAFTLDSDNAGAGVNQQYRANRGSSDAEDAALEWDETNDRWNAKRQHTTGTLCPVNAEKLQVAGTDVVGADGDLEAASVASDQLYTVGANGATPNGLRLTPAGATGAPSAGTHVAGELHVDSAGVIYICTSGGTPGTWQQIGKQDANVVLSVGDGSGSAGGTASCTIQAKDNFGNNRSGTVLFIVRLMDDVDGGVDAPNTSSFTVTVGTLVRTLTANKSFVVKSNASGTLTFTVINSIVDTVYVLTDGAPGSPALECGDTGALTWT